jgi:hypothetical protein
VIRPFNRVMLQAPMGETSASNAPEVKSDNSDVFLNADPNETFDDLEYESPASKKIGEQHQEKFKDKIKKAKEVSSAKEKSQSEDEEKPAKKEEKKKSEVDLLSDKEDVDEEKPKKKEEKKAKTEDEESEEAPKEDAEKALDGEKKGKLKLRMADGLYGIDPDAKVRVKVDGDFQEIPVQDLINNYSGKTAWDKKFTELGTQKKEFETQKGQVEQTQQYLKKTVEDIVSVLDDPNKNPFDALQIIVEKRGLDPYTMWKRSVESALDVVEQLQSMNEAERKAFFLEKKDEFRTKAEEARTKAWQEAESNQQAINKANALRQAHGVSEEQFMTSWDELEAEGIKNPTDEQIVDRASISPHLNTVQDILEPFEDFIDDAKYPQIVSEFARKIRAKEITPEQLKEVAAREFQDEDLKDLQARKTEVVKKKESRKDSEEEKPGRETYESFDDFLRD